MTPARTALTAALLLAAWALAACGGGEPEDRTFKLAIQGGALQGETELEVRQGDNVTFETTTDAPGALHLHGYDLELAVSPGAPASLTFEARATGAYAIAFHPAGPDHGAESPPCVAPLDGVSPQLRVREGAAPGEIVVALDAPNFPLTDGNHWHLFVDDQLYSMYYEPEARLTLGQGARRLTAVLSGPDHCEYGVRTTTMTHVSDGGASGGEGAGTDGGDGGGGHSHAAGGAETILGTLVVRPR
ncbi:MAG: hypothetical protein OXI25_07565 [Chloroflexota bacterium]|nr:hypothetical protein [Chloroflexota bacterium]